MTPGAESSKCFLPTRWGPWGRGRPGGQGQSIGLLLQGSEGLTTLAGASGSSRATGHHRTVDRKQGHARFLSFPSTPPTMQVLLLCPPGVWELPCFEDPRGGLFSFPPAAAVLEMTTRGRAVPSAQWSNWSREGTPRGHAGRAPAQNPTCTFYYESPVPQCELLRGGRGF